MASKIKIKVSCAAILDRATVPWAALVAELSVRGKPETRTKYVLLDDTIRDGLSRMRYDLKRTDSDKYAYSASYDAIGRMRNPECAFPATLRTHAFDSSGVQYEPSEPISRRAGIWSNGESLWVRADLATVVLADLAEWQERTPRNPSQIWAPSWNALLGCQALALVADLPMPGAIIAVSPQSLVCE